jgi:hypothetical protein
VQTRRPCVRTHVLAPQQDLARTYGGGVGEDEDEDGGGGDHDGDDGGTTTTAVSKLTGALRSFVTHLSVGRRDCEAETHGSHPRTHIRQTHPIPGTYICTTLLLS